MRIRVFSSRVQSGVAAASEGAVKIRAAIAERGSANIVVATGASQFEMLEQLVREEGIDWQLVTGFHLDEYQGIPFDHPASFRLYLWQRFISKLPVPLRAFHFLNGEGDCQEECQRVGEIIRQHPIDVAFVGIGENGHLAFNDPPADFEIEEPYIMVDLDEACRRQQLREGWFASMAKVPRRAISMSVQQILKSQEIICTVPDLRKAEAVRNALEGDVTPEVPASILQTHDRALVFLDSAAASLCNGSIRQYAT